MQETTCPRCDRLNVLCLLFFAFCVGLVMTGRANAMLDMIPH